MARSKRERLGFLRRYTFRMTPKPDQEDVLVRHCRITAALWNGCLQRNEDAYRRLSHAKHEMWWLPYDTPRRRSDGTVVEGRYVRRHLAHADRHHSDPEERKLSGDERLAVFGSAKTNLNLFDLTPEITQARRENPEWQEMSKFTLLRVAKAQEEAFGAFFGRAKGGAGKQAGHPQYRATARADWLPHMFNSGCKLTPSAGYHKEGEPVRRWRLYLKGVPGTIPVNGELPAVPVVWLDADIRFRAGVWWLSVCVEVKNRRGGPDYSPPQGMPLKSQPHTGAETATVRFDLIDTLAHVDGIKSPDAEPPSFGDIQVLQDRIDDMKSERDRRWPIKVGQKLSKRRQGKREQMNERIAKLSARVARVRRERLHEWTTTVARESTNLTIIKPPVKEATQSAKGNQDDWGAAVDTVAHVNRHVLSQAPASAVAMLQYKAAEAGTSVNLKEDAKPPVAISRGLSEATKVVRKARRALREAKDHGRHHDGNGRSRGGHQERHETHEGGYGSDGRREAGPSRL